MTGQVVILAAGVGSRLGRPYPKSLVKLKTGRSIMEEQINHLQSSFADVRIMIVVGFKRELIMAEFPDVAYAYNELYEQTNTSKSLLKALMLSGESGVLWLNGDVVFDRRILERVADRIADERSFVCVDRSSVGEEEVKYTVDDRGMVKELSKGVVGALGEAVGINFVGKADKEILIKWLGAVEDQDYFERGMELAIERSGMGFEPIDISDLFAVEVDFEADLSRANDEALSHE